MPTSTGYARYVLVSFDSTGDVIVTDGTQNAGGFNALTAADIPNTPAGNWRSCAVVLYYGQTAIVENRNEIDFYDLRFPEEAAAGLLLAAGSDTQVQYNNGGVLGADARFTFNNTTKAVGIDNVQWNLTPTPIGPAEGLMYWNIDDGTLNLGMPGGNVNLQVGQELLMRVKNQTGSQINNGQLVYVSGGTGNHAIVSLAKADAEITSQSTLGMATENIADNQFGYVTLEGLVRDVNTNAYAPGTMLYLSPTTAGAYTATEPSAPNHQVRVGQVIRQHASQGDIFVRIDNGYELDELHNVLIGTPATYQILTYDSTGPYWKNSGYLIDGTAGGKTVLAVTNTKTLTLTATDNYNLTIPATGTAALLGVANVFTALNTFNPGAAGDLDAIVLDVDNPISSTRVSQHIRFRSWSGTGPYVAQDWKLFSTPSVAGKSAFELAYSDNGAAYVVELKFDPGSGYTTVGGGLILGGGAPASAGKFPRSNGSGYVDSALILPNAATLGDVPYGSATNTVAMLPGNTTTVQKFLSQTGNGSVSAVPSWQPIPVAGLATFFFIDAASSIGGAYKQAVSSGNYTPTTKASLTTAGANTNTVVGTFATNAGFPGLSFIPDGTFHLHIHALHGGGTATLQLAAHIYQRDVGGTETLIVTSEDTSALTTSELEFDVSAVLTQPIALATTDRIVVKWFVSAASAARDVTIYYDGTGVNETFSRIELPTAAIDSSTFVPYTGATAALDMGAHAITATNINLSNTSNQIVLQSAGVTGTITWTPATSNKIITLPNATGTIALLDRSGGQTFTTDQTISGANFTLTNAPLLSQANGANAASFYAYDNTAGNYPYFDFRRARGTIASVASVATADTLGAINFYGKVDGGWANAASIYCFNAFGDGSYITPYMQFGVYNGASFETLLYMYSGAMYMPSGKFLTLGSFTTPGTGNLLRVDGGIEISGKMGIGTAAATSNLQVVGLPTYANNAAAAAGGLTAGAFYRDNGDPDHVCVVH